MRREEHDRHNRKVARIQCITERLLPSKSVPVRSMNYPAASCEVSNPRLRIAMAPPVWRGGCSCGMRTLEQPQLDVLAVQLRIAFVTALLPHILTNDFFI